jgi:hypothetical protein
METSSSRLAPKVLVLELALARLDEPAEIVAAERSGQACLKKPALPSAGGDQLLVWLKLVPSWLPRSL